MVFIRRHIYENTRKVATHARTLQTRSSARTEARGTPCGSSREACVRLHYLDHIEAGGCALYRLVCERDLKQRELPPPIRQGVIDRAKGMCEGY